MVICHTHLVLSEYGRCAHVYLTSSISECEINFPFHRQYLFLHSKRILQSVLWSHLIPRNVVPLSSFLLDCNLRIERSITLVTRAKGLAGPHIVEGGRSGKEVWQMASHERRIAQYWRKRPRLQQIAYREGLSALRRGYRIRS